MECLRLQLLLFSLLSFLLSFFFLKMFTWKKPPSRSLPPGPPKLPIIGNLHQFLGVLPHVSLRRLSDKYGPIIHLRLGSISAVVVASAELAEDVLRTHDLLFCDRPPVAMIKRFTYGRLDMAGYVRRRIRVVNVVTRMVHVRTCVEPRVMKKAQEEVRRVAGVKPKLDEDDLKQLHYIKLVLKETWRLHPPGPLLVPRCCREDCKLAGYAVAAKTWVFVNVWAIGRDPKYWREPEVFRPERFEDSSVDYKGQHFVLLPFGSGRRICPGMALGVAGVELALANLLLRFNWELPDGVRKHGLNMGEAVGISNHRSSPLILKATLATDMP